MNIKVIKSQYPELLLPPEKEDSNNFQKFCQTLQLVFDIPDEIGCAKMKYPTGLMYEVYNRDLIWRPEPKEKIPLINYYHWLTLGTTQREPILSMFSYLFDNQEPYYDESYDFSEEEKKLRSQFYRYLKTHYQTAEDYVEYIAQYLYLNPNQMLHYGVDVDLIRTKLFSN